MSDQELRDKLANEHAISEGDNGNAEISFRDGWDAARDHYGAAFNESQHQLQAAFREREDLRAELSKCKSEYAAYVSGRPGEWYVTQLQKERDQLKSELEKAKQFDLTAAVISKDISLTEECDQLRVQCEKLAEALQFYAYHGAIMSDGENDIALDALAEYHKKFKK